MASLVPRAGIGSWVDVNAGVPVDDVVDLHVELMPSDHVPSSRDTWPNRGGPEIVCRLVLQLMIRADPAVFLGMFPPP